MPLWIHRIDKELLPSVAEADLLEPVANYIEEPDLSAVVGQPTKYWNIVGDDVLLLEPQSARNAADDAERDAARDAAVASMDQLEDYTRAFALVVLDEFNVVRGLLGESPRTIAQLKAAVRGKLGT